MEDVTRWIGSASAAISSASVWLDALIGHEQAVSR